jgi:diguanylate cyclase (GGDEF)-like protein
MAWIALIGLFLVTERTTIRIEFGRQTWYVGMAEFPLALGLFAVDPRTLVICRFASALVVYALSRRISFQKKVFNLVLITLETAIACLVFQLLSSAPAAGNWPDIADPVNWLAATGAVLAFVTAGSACVYAVIWLSQGRQPSRQQALASFVPTIALAPFATVLALVVLLVMHVDPRAAGLVAVLFLIAIIGYRAYARVLTQHATLHQVYGFSQFLERIRGHDDVVADALEHVRGLLNTNTGLLVVSAGSPASSVAVWARAEDAEESAGYVPDLADPIVARCRSGASGVLVRAKSATDAERAALESRGAVEVIAVPLRFRSFGQGHLELWDPQGALRSFTADDLRFLENLASHLAAGIENEQLLDQMRHEAYHDRLTGLPNRARFVQAVDEAIGAAKKNGGVAAAVLLDLDSFKDVNDALGHDYGDELLIMVGQRLREHTPDGGVAARMGADEFAVLCPARDLGAALTAAQELRHAVSKPYLLAGLTVEVGVSIGVSVAPDHAHTGGALMQRADVALTHAKGTGRSDVSYVPSMEQATVHRLQLVTQLREAINAGQVQVHYQPKLALPSRELIGVEALVRWQHPEYGSVMPDEFVPLAERTGLIGPLTMHVLKTSLIQCRSWLDRDMCIGVAVNLSVKNLLDTAFPESVFALLEEHRVPAELLTFEITESSVMSDPERSLPVLHRLHERGIGLSIDDFGTGYSSLAYLRRLPVDEVKIDKVFVLGMGTDLGDMAIVRAIVELGHSLALNVVAEGVEDELARDLLSGMGCDTIQGFLVSRALTAERLDQWLAARTSLGPAQPGLVGRRPQLTG